MTAPTAGEGPVLAAREGGLLWLRLNRPHRLNAVDEPLYRALTAEVDRADRDPSVRAIVLTGAGRAFCAGADLKAHADARRTEDERRRYAGVAQDANLALQRSPKPVVAAVNGPAVGAGLELALSCDLIVVAADARLRLPELVLGSFFGGGLSHTLPRRVGMGRARRILYLGEFFTGDHAASIGLADLAVPVDDVLEAARVLAERLAELAPVSFRLAKRLLVQAPRIDRQEVLRREADALVECMGTADWAEGVRGFSADRPPRSTGE